MGTGTGMPGTMKAGMPMERPMDWKGAFEEAGKSIGHAVGVGRLSEERTHPKPQEDKGSGPSAEPTRKIDWKPAHLTVRDGTHDVFTPRAVRIDATNVSPGIDGTAYTVEWFALDANGNVHPNIRNDRPLPARGGWLLPGRTEDIIEPPFNNDYGWMARIHVPLRESNRGDASKVPLDIYTE